MSALEIESEVKAIFDFADRNGDAVLEKTEIKALFEKLSATPITDAHADSLFTQLDLNSDGSITQLEFTTHVSAAVQRGRHKRSAAELGGAGGAGVDSRKRIKHEIISTFSSRQQL